MKVVMGLGATGLSVVRYLRAHGQEVVVMDSAAQPDGYALLRSLYPDVRCVLGKWDTAYLEAAEEVIISPGVPRQHPLLRACLARQCVVGDIELFARAVKKPVYAITGSNGKTTVTTLLGEMARTAGRRVVVAGNIGPPVLDNFDDPAVEVYVIELSSFQLESTVSLQTESAVVLNVTPDHMDRYANLEAYRATKQFIYRHCRQPVVNADAPDLWQSLALPDTRLSFSVQPLLDADYGVEVIGDKTWLVGHGERLCETTEMPLQGPHHWQNALAALAMGETMGLPVSAMITVLKKFTGLPHRCQKVRTLREVVWYNDSKGTNVGATETAIRSIGHITAGKIILLAGGIGKGADFSVLQPCLAAYAHEAIVLGRDADQLMKAFKPIIPVYPVADLEAAVLLAAQHARPGDAVLLSPACASLDMFKNFEDRGDQFMALVGRL